MKRIALACALACGVGLLLPNETSAFCGFYVAGADAKLFNDATVVVLMRNGTRTVLSMQNNYQGPPEQFALVIPVPVVLKEGDVRTVRRELFDRVETLASPRLVEYWEMDPCHDPDRGEEGKMSKPSSRNKSGLYAMKGDTPTVKIEAEFEVDEYDIIILSATESSGLDAWLRDNDYNIPEGAEPLLRPYVQQDMKFFVAKVDPAKVKFGENGKAKLSPLRFHYDSKDFVLPVRLGLINAPDPSTGGKQDLLIHILAPGTRYEVANRPNVTIPTNLDLNERAKEKFGEFYVSLFDHTLEQNPGAVVTEYAWGALSCDPCPGPSAPLAEAELLELGGDALSDPPADPLAVQPTVKPGKATVKPGSATVNGVIDKDIIRRVVRAHISELQACYNEGLSSNPGMGGRVAPQFVVSPTGKVVSAVISESTVRDSKVGVCFVKAFKRWTFPKSGDNKSTVVTYPFELSPWPGFEPSPDSELSTAPGLTVPPSEFILTRLHARYDATSLGEDLVFQAAPPITGGREVHGPNGELEQGAAVVEGGVDNFQARYAIRHAWTGEIACSEPVRGRWGGPPDGVKRSTPTVAKQLTEVARGASLSSFFAPVGVERASEPAPAESEGSGSKQGCTCSSEPDRKVPFAPLILLTLLGLRRMKTRRDRG